LRRALALRISRTFARLMIINRRGRAGGDRAGRGGDVYARGDFRFTDVASDFARCQCRHSASCSSHGSFKSITCRFIRSRCDHCTPRHSNALPFRRCVWLVDCLRLSNKITPRTRITRNSNASFSHRRHCRPRRESRFSPGATNSQRAEDRTDRRNANRVARATRREEADR